MALMTVAPRTFDRDLELTAFRRACDLAPGVYRGVSGRDRAQWIEPRGGAPCPDAGTGRVLDHAAEARPLALVLGNALVACRGDSEAVGGVR